MAKDFLVRMASDVKKLQVAQQNMLKIGTITEVDYATNKAKACIHMDTERGLTTPLVRWVTSSGGNATEYSAPKIGDTVVILAPGGDLAQALILPWVYKADQSTPGTGENPNPNPGAIYQKAFADGSLWQVDTETGAMVFQAAENGSTLLQGGQTNTKVHLQEDGSIVIEGDVSVEIRKGDEFVRVNTDGVLTEGTYAAIVASAQVDVVAPVVNVTGNINITGVVAITGAATINGQAVVTA